MKAIADLFSVLRIGKQHSNLITCIGSATSIRRACKRREWGYGDIEVDARQTGVRYV